MQKNNAAVIVPICYICHELYLWSQCSTQLQTM